MTGARLRGSAEAAWARAAGMAAAPVTALLLGVLPAAAQAPVSFETLRPALEERISRHRGIVGLALLDPATGESLSIRGDEPFPSASVVKVPLLVEVFQRVEEGGLRLEDPLVMLETDRAPGTGVLQHLTPAFELSVRDAALLMIAFSDNTATNLLLDKVGARNVGERMRALGLSRTEIYRKVFGDAADSFAPDSSEVYGLGVTTPGELARLLALIRRGEAVSPSASEEMRRMLGAQFYRNGLPRRLPEGVRVEHKTGSISAARHDCGLVSSAAREYVLCVMTRENEDRGWTDSNEAEGLIADLSSIVYQALHPGAG